MHLRAARLFDGERLREDATVTIRDGRILAVGETPPSDATVVDLPGATLLPGLVDAHVHLAFDASADPVAGLADREDAATAEAIAAAARYALRGGVTTVRDLGDVRFLSLGVRDAARSDPALPHIVAAGVPVTTPGGHCHFLGEPAAGADGVRAAVRDRHDRGVDVIKVMASGGNLTPGSRPDVAQYTVDEMRAVVAEAHRLGLPVTAHAHGTSAVVAAVEAGVDSIEHASFMTADDVDEIPPGLLDRIVARGIALSLTFGNRPVDGAAPPPAIARRMPKLLANARLMHSAGARIVVGTDGGIAPIKPHDAVRYALPQLAAIGLSPAEQLRAVTSRAAEVLRLGDRKGRLAAGYDADVLAVDGDLLTHPEAIHRIAAVYRCGVRVV
ncbi:MAG: amidohydrolase family protein [Streptomycetaceae bacterium]|nr:amidohydrolase family protein [Streptomycetaceae bacterium]